jgi:hypothetical protein
MKTKQILLFLMFTALFTGCKNEKSIDSLDVVKPEEVVENAFKVTLEVIVKKDDDFSLYYTEDGSIDFSKIAPIWVGVKGSESPQKVVFTLPEEVLPTELRLDFGMNKAQEDIILKSVTMEYIGKTRTIGCPELVSFFRADDNKCTFDHVTGTIKALVKDGVRQYPSLYPHETMLMPEIQKIIN